MSRPQTLNVEVKPININDLEKEILKKFKEDFDIKDEQCMKFLENLVKIIILSIEALIEVYYETDEKIMIIYPKELEKTIKTKIREKYKDLTTNGEALQLPEDVAEKCIKKFIKKCLPEVSKKLEEYFCEELKKISDGENILKLFAKCIRVDPQKTLQILQYYVDEKFIANERAQVINTLSKINNKYQESVIQHLFGAVFIFSEGLYKKFLSMLIDAIRVINGEKPHLKDRPLNKVFSEWKKYSEEYRFLEKYFIKEINDIRNAYAHRSYDYNIDDEENPKVELFPKSNKKIVVTKEMLENYLKIMGVSLEISIYLKHCITSLIAQKIDWSRAV